jgi:hypothetical protein
VHLRQGIPRNLGLGGVGPVSCSDTTQGRGRRLRLGPTAQGHKKWGQAVEKGDGVPRGGLGRSSGQVE